MNSIAFPPIVRNYVRRQLFGMLAVVAMVSTFAIAIIILKLIFQ